MSLGQTVMSHLLNCPEEEFGKLTVKALAASFGVSRGHLSRVFKSEIGFPLGTVLCRERLERAKELLRRQPSLSLTEVAERVGFAAPGYFCRLFKDYFRIPPGELRRRPAPPA